jgi:acetylornithine/succinyldiaminopimelate/putrescine aminotransferase
MALRELAAYERLALPVVRAEGCELVLEDGRRVLDLYGGHCVNSLGAGDPALANAIAAQWRKLSFTTNLLDHAPRKDFLDAFEKNLPASRDASGWEIFCSNSGAEANENALKLALAATGRRKVVAFRGAFHGRTAAASAVTDRVDTGFPQAPFDVVRLPWSEPLAAARTIDASVACVILEPIQSLAGVTEPGPGFLETLRVACDRVGALLCFDEVQTGNGRLGAPWASQHFGIVPDLFTTAKGAAGGLPIGLTVARADVAQSVPGRLFGSTFGGGPLVLAAAAEVARRIASPGFLENVREASAALREAALGGSGAAAQKAGVGGPVQSVRGVGLLLGLVLAERTPARALRDRLLERGILVGTSDDPRVLRLSPPLTIEPRRAAKLAEALASAEVLV